MPLRPLLLATALLLPVACGDDDGGTATADAAVAGADAAGSDAGDGLTTLITGDWTIPAGAEIYHCVRLTVPTDMLITEFHPIIPPGTHHTVLGVANPGSTPDGQYACSFTEIGQKRGLYGTGVGANDFVLPDRVAIKVLAGEQLVLNLHLYNTGDSAITGTSGVAVKLAQPSEVDFEADSDLFGAITNLVVPPGTHTITANCTASANMTVFALSPHMHKLGVHMKGTLTPAGGSPVVLVDDEYSFLEQLVTVLPQPIQLQSGDALKLECTYDNPGATTVTFGDSSDDEMCFLGLYRYPAGSPFINCN